jgi:hypothetical protein
MKSKRRTWRVFGSILLVFAVTFLLLEIFLRTTHFSGARVSWSSPDPQIGWRFKPNFEYWYDSRENDHPIIGRTNNFSWNDKDWLIEKDPGVYRVAILGDSYVEGLQVEQDKHFVALAQADLNHSEGQPGRRFELMNFGRSGFF